MTMTAVQFHLEIVPPDMAADLATTVKALKSHWIRRHPLAPAFTLGAASSYCSGNEEYLDYARRMNPVLNTHFGQLHRRMHEAMESALGEPVEHAHDKSLPGFHIFEPHFLFAIKPGNIHLDSQYKDLDWSRYAEIDFKRTLSFTIPLELPDCGAGLRTWPTQAIEDGQIEPSQSSPADAVTQRECTVVDYELGCMVIHDGRMVHQIAPPRGPWTRGSRITCQGHALYCDGAWRTYW